MENVIFPSGEMEFISFMDNFNLKMASYGKSLGFTPEDIVSIGKQVNVIRKLMNTVIKKEKELEQAREAFQEGREAVIKDFRKKIKIIKSNPAYTELLGYDLGISNKDVTEELNVLKPAIEVKIVRSVPVIRFNKFICEGVRIYCQRGEEKSFSLIGVDSRSPYYDIRMNRNQGIPELRQYFIKYIYNGREVGLPSEVQSIVVGKENDDSRQIR